MWLPLLALLTALTISSVSAYFSIVGLTAIFAAAKLSIIILGSALEFGKVVSTLFVHRHWKDLTWGLKSYLSIAIVILMLITSMGTFGFLSKAHLDQALPSSDNQIQLNIIDQKIKTDQDNIASAKQELAQLDAAVNQMMTRTTDATGAQRSVNIRKNQAKDRQRIADTIDSANKDILALQQQEAPLKAEQNKLAVEVGPIKYIADLLYGSSENPDVLEKAVRIVIIMLVMVFDPLAIILLLASTKVLEILPKKKLFAIKEKTNDFINPFYKKEPEIVNVVEPIIEPKVEETPVISEPALDIIIEPIEEELSEDMKAEYEDRIKNLMEELNKKENQIHHKSILNESLTISMREKEKEIEELNSIIEHKTQEHKDESQKLREEIQEKADKLSELNIILDNEKHISKMNQDNVENLKQEIERILSEHCDYTTETMIYIDSLNSKISSLEENNMDLQKEITKHSVDVMDLSSKIQELSTPEAHASRMFKDTEQIENQHPFEKLNFGVEFPEEMENGELFVITDVRPHQLYKWVDDYGWITIDKNITDSYITDMYVNYLIDKLASGEYDFSELTDAEQQRLTEMLSK